MSTEKVPSAVPMPVPTTRDSIRASIFADRPTSKVVELPDGTKIEVREGDVGMLMDAISIENPKKRMAQLLIMSCFVPGTDTKVFDETDFDSLMKLPYKGKFRKLMDAINDRLDIGDNVIEAGKE